MTSLPFALISGYFLNSILWLLSLSAVDAQPLCPICFCKFVALNPDLLNPEFMSWIRFELEIWCCPVIFAPFLIHVFNFFTIWLNVQSAQGLPNKIMFETGCWSHIDAWLLRLMSNLKTATRTARGGNTFSMHSLNSIPDEIITTIIGAWNLYFNAITV